MLLPVRASSSEDPASSSAGCLCLPWTIRRTDASASSTPPGTFVVILLTRQRPIGLSASAASSRCSWSSTDAAHVHSYALGALDQFSGLRTEVGLHYLHSKHTYSISELLKLWFHAFISIATAAEAHGCSSNNVRTQTNLYLNQYLCQFQVLTTD